MTDDTLYRGYLLDDKTAKVSAKPQEEELLQTYPPPSR